MKNRTRAALCGIEPLEARIAPAVITATLAGGSLTLGSPSPNVGVQFEQISASEWVLTGTSGDTVAFNGAPARVEVFVKGITGDITTSFLGGPAFITFLDSTAPKNVVIHGGYSTELLLQNSSVRGSLTLTGDTADDTVTFEGFKSSIGKDFIFAGGDGGTTVEVKTSFFTVGGRFSQTGLNGDDVLHLTSGVVKIGGDLEFDGGASGGSGKSTVALTPARLTIGGNLSLAGVGVFDDFNVSPVGILRVAKAITITGGDGPDTVRVADGSVAAIVGSISIDTRLDTADDTVRIAPVALLQVAGAVLVTQQYGGDTVISADVSKIGGALGINMLGNGGTVSAKVAANTSLSVKGDLTISSNENDIDSQVISGGALTIGGKLLLESTAAGAATTGFTVSAITGRIGKDLTMKAVDSAYQGSLTGGNFTIGGELHAEDAGTKSKFFSVGLNSLTVKKTVNVLLSGGFLSANFRVAGALNVVGDFNVIHNFGAGGGGAGIIDIRTGAGNITGNVFFNHSGTQSTLNLVTTKTPLKIGGGFSANFDETTSLSASLTGVSVAKDFLLTSGGTNDVVFLDDASIKGTTSLFLGGGGDGVKIETLATHARRTSTFGKAVDIELPDFGSGNDGVTIGASGDATRRATFLALATFEGGLAGLDTITFANAAFPAGRTVSNFEFVL